MTFQTLPLPPQPTVTAPDGSLIRLLVSAERGSMVHCSLPPGFVTTSVAHHAVEEVWYFLEGQGQVWRKQGEREAIVDVSPGLSLTIPTGTRFQFRNTGPGTLSFLIVTMPPWPGDDEAYPVEGIWEPEAGG